MSDVGCVAGLCAVAAGPLVVEAVGERSDQELAGGEMKERCPSEVRTDLRGPVGRWMRQSEHQRVRWIFRVIAFRLQGGTDDGAVNILRGKKRRQIADHELGEPSVSRNLQTQTPSHLLELALDSPGKHIEPVDR